MESTPPSPAGAARRSPALFYVLCLGAFGAAAFWAQRVLTDRPAIELRALMPVATVWGLHACVLVGLAALGRLAVPVARLLGRKHLLVGLGLAGLAYAGSYLAPQVNRIFYDEHIYMQIGQTIAHTGRAEYANYARVEYGDVTIYHAWVNKQPNGHPYLLSWVYRIFGVSEGAAFAAVHVASALAVAVLYFALVLAPWALPAGAPVAAALALAFTPLVLWWSRTAAVEPTAAASAVAVVFAVCIHARWRDPATGAGSPWTAALLAAAAAFAAYFRPESLLVFPVAAALLWAADRRFLEDRVTWAALALSVALLTPGLLHLWSVRTEDWGAKDGHRFGLAFILKNLDSNVGYFTQQKWYPLAGTILALAGAGWLLARSRRLALGAGLWFALSWGVFVLFYAGGYYYGASSRYAIISAAPVAVLVGIGAAAAAGALRRWPAVGLAVAVAAAMNWAAAMQYVPTLGRESNEARADVAFAREVAARLPTGALVISTDPCIWNVLGRNSAQLFEVEGMVRHHLRELVRQYPGGVYLHWDYWVNTEADHATIWRQLILDTRATVFARLNAEDVQFAVFRLDTPHALQAMGGEAAPSNRPIISVDAVAAEAQAERPAESPAAAPAAPPAPPEPTVP